MKDKLLEVAKERLGVLPEGCTVEILPISEGERFYHPVIKKNGRMIIGCQGDFNNDYLYGFRLIINHEYYGRRLEGIDIKDKRWKEYLFEGVEELLDAFSDPSKLKELLK